MSAGESLNPRQFRFSYQPVSDGHQVVAQAGNNRKIGELTWGENGEIALVHVSENQRRRGVATGMHAAGRAFADLHGIPEPQHSDDRTPSGDAWAKSVSPAHRIPGLNSKFGGI